jgi:hypothetical protein
VRWREVEEFEGIQDELGKPGCSNLQHSSNVYGFNRRTRRKQATQWLTVTRAEITSLVTGSWAPPVVDDEEGDAGNNADLADDSHWVGAGLVTSPVGTRPTESQSVLHSGVMVRHSCLVTG